MVRPAPLFLRPSPRDRHAREAGISTPLDRRALRAALLDLAPWLADPDVGPTTVDAGECDRCRARPRIVRGCGPSTPGSLCAECVAALGVDEVWCDGHEAEGREVLAHLARLPADWAEHVRLWWVATGEVRLDDDAVHLLRDGALARSRPALRDALGGDG
ncbi:MAG: hypothetical protein ACLGIR_14100 [Actinomycetes bacterium]